MRSRVGLYGAGGHGKVIADVVKAMGSEISCVFDKNPEVDPIAGVDVISAEEINQFEDPIIITVGNNEIRKKIAREIENQALKFGKAIHPKAIIAEDAEIGEGTMICHGTIVQTGARIGKHCIINTGTIIEHDCTIGDFVHISPGAILCGKVTVGEGSWVGAGSVVIQCREIGEWSVVGAGSVVIKDVPSGVLSCGNPAVTKKQIIPPSTE